MMSLPSPPIPTTSSSSPTTTTAVVKGGGWRQYFRSYRFVELLLCLVPTIIGLLLDKIVIEPRQRPIPYQVLDINTNNNNDGGGNNNNGNNNDDGGTTSSNQYIVWNQMYGLDYSGETISTFVLVTCSLFLPVLLQLGLIAWGFRTTKKKMGQNQPDNDVSNDYRDDGYEGGIAIVEGGTGSGGGGGGPDNYNDGTSPINNSNSDNNNNNNNNNKSLMWDAIHRTLCVYLMGSGLTVTITNVLKLYVGYLRPIFLTVCQPESSGGGDDDGGDMTCTASYEDEQSVRLSFPSGHSSMTFCGLLLFSQFLDQEWWGRKHDNDRPTSSSLSSTAAAGTVVWVQMEGDDDEIVTTTDQHIQRRPSSHRSISCNNIEQQSQILRPIMDEDNNSNNNNNNNNIVGRGRQQQQQRRRGILRMVPPDTTTNERTGGGTAASRLSRIVTVLCYSPMLLAIFIATSRLADNKHFPADVVGGSLLGGSIALLVFGIWFPV